MQGGGAALGFRKSSPACLYSLKSCLILATPDKFLFSEPFKSSQIGVIVNAVLIAVICSAEIWGICYRLSVLGHKFLTTRTFWSSEQPGLLECVPARGRKWNWMSFKLSLNQNIPWFQDIHNAPLTTLENDNCQTWNPTRFVCYPLLLIIYPVLLSFSLLNLILLILDALPVCQDHFSLFSSCLPCYPNPLLQQPAVPPSLTNPYFYNHPLLFIIYCL